jgi:Na+/H+ antiporter NhaA
LVIVPLFALANVGIDIDGHLIGEAIASPITLGIVAGYVVGKPLGTVVGAALVSRSLLRGIGRGLSWPVIAAGGVVNGLGFTVSLLISSIAFRG